MASTSSAVASAAASSAAAGAAAATGAGASAGVTGGGMAAASGTGGALGAGAGEELGSSAASSAATSTLIFQVQFISRLSQVGGPGSSTDLNSTSSGMAWSMGDLGWYHIDLDDNSRRRSELSGQSCPFEPGEAFLDRITLLLAVLLVVFLARTAAQHLIWCRYHYVSELLLFPQWEGTVVRTPRVQDE